MDIVGALECKLFYLSLRSYLACTLSGSHEKRPDYFLMYPINEYKHMHVQQCKYLQVGRGEPQCLR